MLHEGDCIPDTASYLHPNVALVSDLRYFVHSLGRSVQPLDIYCLEEIPQAESSLESWPPDRQPLIQSRRQMQHLCCWDRIPHLIGQ